MSTEPQEKGVRKRSSCSTVLLFGIAAVCGLWVIGSLADGDKKQDADTPTRAAARVSSQATTRSGATTAVPKPLQTPVPTAPPLLPSSAWLSGIDCSEGSGAYGELVVPEINIWEAHGLSRILGDLPHGAQVDVLERVYVAEESRYWYRIRADSLYGWVSAAFVQDTPPGESGCPGDPAATSEPLLDLSTCQIDAAFVADVTIPDGMEMAPGEQFRKVWTVRNTGTCPWSELVALTHVGGEAFGLAQSVPLSDVAPGGEQDVAVQMEAPEKQGTYRSEWRVCYEGECFGTLLFVQIRVVEPTPTASPDDVLRGYIDLLNDSGMGAYVATVALDGDPGWIKITVRSSWHYEPKQIRLQAAQLLWEAWARGFCSASSVDACRIRLVDLAGNEVGGSSWLAGSIISVVD